jgi:hypothetical protein
MLLLARMAADGLVRHIDRTSSTLAAVREVFVAVDAVLNGVGAPATVGCVSADAISTEAGMN